MARTVTCLRCSSSLRVPPASPDEFLTCPRCLAEVSNPARQVGASGVQTAPAERGGADSICPQCGESVGRDWRYCPNCQEPLRGQSPRGRSAEVDVRRDNTFLRVSMILLATLGGIGVALTLLLGVSAASGGEYTMLGYFLAGLFIVGLIGALTVVLGKGKKDTAHAIGLAAFRSLTLAGAIVLLFCVLLMAGFIYLSVLCLKGDFRF